MRKLKDLTKAEKQGIRAANKMDKTGESRHTAEDKNDGYSRSILTHESNKSHLRVASTWYWEVNAERFKTDRLEVHFDKITEKEAVTFLNQMAADISDKKLAGYAVALQNHMRINGGHDNLKLKYESSEIPSILASRAYIPAAVQLIESTQTPRAALSTRIIDEAGIRAHELHTLRRIDEREVSPRGKWRSDTFAGRENWARYTVRGKGGLVREVRMTQETAAKLEATRQEPTKVLDRDVTYRPVYNLMGGKSYSNSFSKRSIELLGHSNGAHGLRHTYAQNRMHELTTMMGKIYSDARYIVSNELGHFRPSITDIYLR